jgi:dihydroorotate dehydrogenase electron transfer subunit
VSKIEVNVVNTAKPGHYETTVVENRQLSRRYYLLVLERPAAMPAPAAGTFIHLAVPHAQVAPGGADGRFFLRRPFSILDSDEKTLSLIIVEKGEGTQIMRRLVPGSAMDLIGPLGSSFPRVPGKRVLALGGGVGLAPLYYYWKHRDASDCESFRLLYGARDKEDLFIDSFSWDVDKIGFSSDDGSYGFAGNVVQFAASEIERTPVDVIFSCGPNPMLRAAVQFAAERSIPHFVCLENRMACALGACRSCVVLTRNGDEMRYRTVCHDGPVFDAGTLVWKELPDA